MAGLAFDPQAAAHVFDELACDGQTQPGAAEAARGGAVGLREGPEQPRLLLGVEPHAGVLDPAVQGVVVGVDALYFEADGDVALLGELDGVGAQVDQHLAQPGGVAHQVAGQVARRGEEQLEALFLGLQTEHVGHLLDHGFECEGHVFEFEVAGFDLRHVEDVVEDLQQVLGGAMRLLDVVAGLLGQVVVERQQGHADHGIHRRADLVAHVGQKGRLGAGGGFGRCFGFDQGDLGGLALRDVLHDGAHVRAAVFIEGDDNHLAVKGRAVQARVPPFETEDLLLRDAPEDAAQLVLQRDVVADWRA